MTRTTLIYVLRDPRNGAVRYVGKTVQKLSKRLKAHIARSPKKQTHRDCWIASLAALGLAPRIEQVAEAGDDWAEAERAWISHFRGQGCDLTNQSDGGEGTPGVVHSAKWRAACAIRQSERMSPEYRARLSEKVAASWTEERRLEKASEMAAHWTDERRARISGMSNEPERLSANVAAQKAYWTPERRAERARLVQSQMTPDRKAKQSALWTDAMRAAQAERTRIQHAKKKAMQAQ